MKNQSRDNVYLFGGGGHAKVVMDVLRLRYGQKCVSAIFDDEPSKAGLTFYNTSIISSEMIKSVLPENLIIAIGDNSLRKKVYQRISSYVNHFINALHPTVTLSETAALGSGILAMPNVCINADAEIGNHVILNTNCIIEHDCRIDDFVHIAPGVTLTGGVSVGALTLVGANATIVPGKTIGRNCLVGSGSVVTKNVPDNTFVFGNPAKIISKRKT